MRLTFFSRFPFRQSKLGMAQNDTKGRMADLGRSAKILIQPRASSLLTSSHHLQILLSQREKGVLLGSITLLSHCRTLSYEQNLIIGYEEDRIRVFKFRDAILYSFPRGRERKSGFVERTSGLSAQVDNF